MEKECIIKIYSLTWNESFFNKKTLEEKLQMCKEHVDEGKSLSHVCEIYEYHNIDDRNLYSDADIHYITKNTTKEKWICI